MVATETKIVAACCSVLMMLPSWAWAQLYAPPDATVDLPVQVVQSAQNRTPEEIRAWAFTDEYVLQYLVSNAYSIGTFEAMWPAGDPDIHAMIVEPPDYPGQIVLIDSTVDPEEAEELPVVDTGTFTEFARYAADNVAVGVSFVAGTFSRSGSELVVVGLELAVVVEDADLPEPIVVRTFRSLDVIPDEDLAHATAYRYAVLSANHSSGSGGKDALVQRTHPAMMAEPEGNNTPARDNCGCFMTLRHSLQEAQDERNRDIASLLGTYTGLIIGAVAACLAFHFFAATCVGLTVGSLLTVASIEFEMIDTAYVHTCDRHRDLYDACCDRTGCVCPGLPCFGQGDRIPEGALIAD